MKKYWFFLFIGLFFVMIFSDTLSGIPAFARKYKMSCSVCHMPFPRLKAYGEEFAGNGFVLKDKETPRNSRDTGDDTLSLIKELPFAFRIEGHTLYNNSHRKTLDFAAPYLVKLLSGGTIAKNLSYYFYFFLGERGKVVGLEDAFIMFGDIFKSGISLTVGQFQVSDPLFKRELRLTFEDYQVYKAKPGLSVIDLTYDRGVIFNKGFESGTDFTVEILNGNGIEEANIFKNFDNDKYKNVFGRISQDIGEHFRLGGCAYYGKEAHEDAVDINKVRLWGADASFLVENFNLNAQYIERSDNNPGFQYRMGGEREVVTRGGFVEAIYTPQGDKGKWYAVGLFNWVDSEEPDLEYRSVSAHMGFLFRRNFRLVSEVTYIFKSEYGKHARVGIGLITAL